MNTRLLRETLKSLAYYKLQSGRAAASSTLRSPFAVVYPHDESLIPHYHRLHQCRSNYQFYRSPLKSFFKPIHTDIQPPCNYHYE
jgi:hypothetical protein